MGNSNRFLRLALAAVLFVLLCAWRFAGYYPPLPNPLTVDLVLDPGAAGRADPLIVSGETNHGDFLLVRFDDERTIRFVYDRWGLPNVASKPVTLPPDRRLRLRISVPALDQIQGNVVPNPNRARIEIDGAVILDEPVVPYVRTADRIFFAENPIGGTTCGPVLHGRLHLADGRELRGGVNAIFTLPRRLSAWLTHVPGVPLTLLVFSLVVAWHAHRLRSLPAFLPRATRALLRHRWCVGTTLACSFVFTWLVTLGSFQFNHGEVFGSFYDYQAQSFLQFRLDVPEEAIGGEAFEARGKLFGYFGPVPALLRVPFVLWDVAFGKLSRAFMLGYFVASLVATYLLLREALRHVRSSPSSDDVIPSPFATVVLLTSAGLGSTIFFLGSRGLIFHEAILGGITFALWSCWCSLHHLRASSEDRDGRPARSRWWLAALLFGLASLHTRPPTGLFALTLLGCVALAIAFRRDPTGSLSLATRWRHAIILGLLCFAAQLSLNALAWLKFRTFDAAPLAISRPYTSMPNRLEHIQGRSFHLSNIPYNVDAYFLFPNYHLAPQFPWIYLIAKEPRREFPAARIDLPDHTLALPYAMPSLFALATLSCLLAAILHRSARLAILVVYAAALPMTLALLAAIATAQRYTGDFVPFLITAAALGLAGLETAASALRLTARTLLIPLTLGAVAVTFALTIHYQGETLWGVPEHVRERYRDLRHRIDTALGVPPPKG